MDGEDGQSRGPELTFVIACSQEDLPLQNRTLFVAADLPPVQAFELRHFSALCS